MTHWQPTETLAEVKMFTGALRFRKPSQDTFRFVENVCQASLKFVKISSRLVKTPLGLISWLSLKIS